MKRQKILLIAALALLSEIPVTLSLSQAQLRPPPSTSAGPSPTFPPALRMSVADFQRQFQTGALDDRPIVITDALSVPECEQLCQQWIDAVGDEPITIQRKKRRATTQLYDCTVHQSLDLIMQSNPNDSIFAFVEGLLEESSPPSISTKLVQTREQLFPANDPNWFDYFPSSAQPTDCVILAGEGKQHLLVYCTMNYLFVLFAKQETQKVE